MELDNRTNDVTECGKKTMEEIKQEVLEAVNLTATDTEITLVTMYLKLGDMKKGPCATINVTVYEDWLSSWTFITNPVIGYFDDDDIIDQFSEARSHLPPSRSIIKKVNRTDLSSYKNYLEPIRQIFQQKGYPKHPPNTVVPEYSCAMHAKYDVVEMAMNQEQINTKYLAWLDIGLLRHEIDSEGPISLHVPSTFDELRISYSEVSGNKTLFDQSPRENVDLNSVWVAGGFFVATPELMRKHIQAYRGALKEMVTLQAVSTDQQTLLSLYSNSHLTQEPVVTIQSHACLPGDYGLDISDSAFFCFTYRCKEAGNIVLKKAMEQNSNGSYKCGKDCEWRGH